MSLNRLCVFAISLYQRFLSPVKGFRCAANVFYGTGSCSARVKDIILTDGVFGGRTRIRDQFRRCRLAAETLQLFVAAPAPAGEEADDGSVETKKKKKRNRVCDGLEAIWCVPDASDCSASSACSGAGDFIGGVCSCS